MSIIRSNPVLASLHIPTTVEFYEQTLGFTRSFCDEGYGIVQRNQIAIHFWKCESTIFPENTSCYLYTDDVDSLYTEFEIANVIHPNGQLEDKP